MEGSRGRGRVCGVHDHQGQALAEVVRVMPCWAVDSKSRSQRSRAASIAVCSQEYSCDYGSTALQILVAAVAITEDVPAVRGPQRTSQPGMLETPEMFQIPQDRGDVCVARG